MTEPKKLLHQPSWLNINLIKAAVQNKFKHNLKILESKTERATNAGDNYGSQMLRFKLLIETETKQQENVSVVAKIKTTGELGNQTEKLSVFEKEIYAYSVVLPALNDCLKQAYPDSEKMWADCYYHQKPPNEVLIFEDLRVGGFTLGKRSGGLDRNHAILVLKSLGKLHAASLVAKAKEPNLFKNLGFPLWHRENSHVVQNILGKPFSTLVKSIQNWPDFDQKEKYQRKLEKMENIILEKAFEALDFDENNLNALLHGDSWINNFMFKHDNSGKPDSIKFVDFQIIHYNSPVLDLLYFIFSSVSPEIKFDSIDFFLKNYHESFTETLEKLNYQLQLNYGFDELKKEFKSKLHWGLIIFCSIYPFVDYVEAFDADEYFSKNSTLPFEKVYSRNEVREGLKKGLDYFEKMGIF